MAEGSGPDTGVRHSEESSSTASKRLEVRHTLLAPVAAEFVSHVKGGRTDLTCPRRSWWSMRVRKRRGRGPGQGWDDVEVQRLLGTVHRLGTAAWSDVRHVLLQHRTVAEARMLFDAVVEGRYSHKDGVTTPSLPTRSSPQLSRLHSSASSLRTTTTTVDGAGTASMSAALQRGAAGRATQARRQAVADASSGSGSSSKGKASGDRTSADRVAKESRRRGGKLLRWAPAEHRRLVEELIPQLQFTRRAGNISVDWRPAKALISRLFPTRNLSGVKQRARKVMKKMHLSAAGSSASAPGPPKRKRLLQDGEEERAHAKRQRGDGGHKGSEAGPETWLGALDGIEEVV